MKFIIIDTDLDTSEVEGRDRVREILAAYLLDPFMRMSDFSALDHVGGSVLVTAVAYDYQSTVPVVRVIRIA